MPGISVNLDLEIIDKIKAEAKKSGSSLSSVVNFHLRDFFQKIDKEKKEIEEITKKYNMVVCEVCGAKYSSILNKCPQCAENAIKKAEEAEKDIEKVYEKEQEEKKKQLEELRAKIDASEKRVEIARAAARTYQNNGDSWHTSKERQEVIDAEMEYEHILQNIYQLENEIKVKV